MGNLAVLACAVLLAGGCASADLPAGWEDAERIEGLSQAPCGSSALLPDRPDEALRWQSAETRLDIAYDHAHFRCEQEVQGFLRKAGERLDVLVQPVDMDPGAVAGCDCLYDISMQIPLARGAYSLSLFRRWDNLNNPNPPVEIGRADIELP